MLKSLQPGAFKTAYDQAFPGMELPADVEALRTQVAQAMQGGGSSEAMRALDRICERADPADLERLFTQGGTVSSEKGRQQAADLVGRGDPAAHLRQFTLQTPYDRAADTIADPQLLELIKRELAAGKRVGFRNMVIDGNREAVTIAVGEYGRALHAADLVDSATPFVLPAQSDAATMWSTLKHAVAAGRTMVVADLDTFVRDHSSRLARELLVFLNENKQVRVVFHGTQRSLEKFFDSDPGLARRIPGRLSLRATPDAIRAFADYYVTNPTLRIFVRNDLADVASRPAFASGYPLPPSDSRFHLHLDGSVARAQAAATEYARSLHAAEVIPEPTYFSVSADMSQDYRVALLAELRKKGPLVLLVDAANYVDGDRIWCGDLVDLLRESSQARVLVRGSEEQLKAMREASPELDRLLKPHIRI